MPVKKLVAALYADSFPRELKASKTIYRCIKISFRAVPYWLNTHYVFDQRKLARFYAEEHVNCAGTVVAILHSAADRFGQANPSFGFCPHLWGAPQRFKGMDDGLIIHPLFLICLSGFHTAQTLCDMACEILGKGSPGRGLTRRDHGSGVPVVNPIYISMRDQRARHEADVDKKIGEFFVTQDRQIQLLKILSFY